MLLKVGGAGCTIVIAPPVPDEGIMSPFASLATTPAIWTVARESSAPGEMLKVAVAATPLVRTLVFIPNRMHIVLPLLLEQVTLLPAAVALAPATTFTLAMSVAG
jgi:hypothetical protein